MLLFFLINLLGIYFNKTFLVRILLTLLILFCVVLFFNQFNELPWSGSQTNTIKSGVTTLTVFAHTHISEFTYTHVHAQALRCTESSTTQSNRRMHEAVRPSLAAALFICVAVEIFPGAFCHALSASLSTQPTGATGVSFVCLFFETAAFFTTGSNWNL